MIQLNFGMSSALRRRITMDGPLFCVERVGVLQIDMLHFISSVSTVVYIDNPTRLTSYQVTLVPYVSACLPSCPPDGALGSLGVSTRLLKLRRSLAPFSAL